jgi:hypothetical protein
MSSLKPTASEFVSSGNPNPGIEGVPLSRSMSRESTSEEEKKEASALLKEAVDVGTSGAEKGGRKRRGRKTRKHPKRKQSKKTRKH